VGSFTPRHRLPRKMDMPRAGLKFLRRQKSLPLAGNQTLDRLAHSPATRSTTLSRTMNGRGMQHVWGWRNLRESDHLEAPGVEWEGNIKMVLQEVG
jgi:hypothetical protein